MVLIIIANFSINLFYYLDNITEALPLSLDLNCARHRNSILVLFIKNKWERDYMEEPTVLASQ